MPSKKELIEVASRAKRRDPGAFATLFDLFFEKMRRYMYFHTGDLDAAEELAAEVFTTCLESIDRFDDRGGTIGPWLYGIARNLLAEHRRRDGRVTKVPIETVTLAATSGNPEGAVLAGLTHQDLYSALSGLPREQREIVILRFIEGYRVKEAAGIMGKTPGAVRALQHRAVVSLRKAFKVEEPER